jgi:hypothetical protein
VELPPLSWRPLRLGRDLIDERPLKHEARKRMNSCEVTTPIACISPTMAFALDNRWCRRVGCECAHQANCRRGNGGTPSGSASPSR